MDDRLFTAAVEDWLRSSDAPSPDPVGNVRGAVEHASRTRQWGFVPESTHRRHVAVHSATTRSTLNPRSMFSAPRIAFIGLVLAFILGAVSFGLLGLGVLQPMTDPPGPAVLTPSPSPSLSVAATVVADVTSAVADTVPSAPPDECDRDDIAMIIPTVPIVVAARPIEAGASIWSKHLTLREVPPDASNAMALTDIELARGEMAAIDIVENQPITPNMFVSGQGTALAASAAASPDAAPCDAGLVYPTMEVVVASGGIARGTMIVADMLMTRAVLLDATSTVALASLDDAIGRVAAIDILPNQPVSPNMLSTGYTGRDNPAPSVSPTATAEDGGTAPVLTRDLVPGVGQ